MRSGITALRFVFEEETVKIHAIGQNERGTRYLQGGTAAVRRPNGDSSRHSELEAAVKRLTAEHGLKNVS